ncbi:MAG: multidrug efflux RND transporter permease subunit [Candidatus Hydrogenedentes bacterium]|nr:multidrug efflux RND transporter permease subunit [Candidatus Hydrogenedentota bacterium]
MISRFFIDRPVFASVISIVIVLCGLGSMYFLPIESSPQIAPPTVIISATYPGADAETVMQSVATPIEQELSGIEHLLYYQSQSSNDGSLSITLTFDINADLDIAAVEVQNRLKRAEPRLPQEVARQGTTVDKRLANFLGVVALRSDDPEHDALYLSNYATIYMLDTLKRVPGVGGVIVFGGKDYTMRISLNPDRLVLKNLTMNDVAQAIREQNGQYAAGQIGNKPNPNTLEFTFPVLTPGRLKTPEEFENIILRANPDGSMVQIKDVGTVELGALAYNTMGRFVGEQTAIMVVTLQPGANSLNTMKGVQASLKELEKAFPKGVSYELPVDITKFIRVSIEEVAKTFAEAILLVLIVVLVFLGSWRAALIPLLAVPVAIVGTFTGLMLVGFSINTLTLFALVLAIGIVVDDAIVVVENVERIMHEEHLPPREATIKAMDQVTGPIIAIVLVLSSVYLPVAFLSGSTGVMYRQFGVTIAVSVAISGLVALTLSPALCRLLLKPNHNKIFIFRWFDSMFNAFAGMFTTTARWAIRLGVISVALFGVLLWTTYKLFLMTPTAFVPQEDQGYFMIAAQLPQGASLDRTSAVVHEIEEFLKQQPEVEAFVALLGQDLLSNTMTTSGATMFVNLKHWSERPGPEHHADAIVGRIFGRFGSMKEATVLAFVPPPIFGLGLRAGFEAQLEGRGVSDIKELAKASSDFVAELNKDPMFMGVNAVLNIGQPKVRVNLDYTRAKLLGLPIADIYNTLQAYLGSYYVNDFNIYGRVYRVQIQADPEFREKPDDIRRIHVRNEAGEMVELASVLDVSMESGPNAVSRFNSFPSVQITGSPGQGFSTGQCIQRVKEVAAATLPPGYAIEWSGGSYLEEKAGSQSVYIIAFGLVMVFLVLAAQYEKWSLPFAVLLAVPFGAFGAVVTVYLRHTAADIYFQIGLLTLVGLAAKNAILIVEFCSKLREEGKGIVESALIAARLRLRPIVMTSLAFILGVLPLVTSQGAGAAGRHSIGSTVMGGMISATFLAVFFVPLFFVIIQGISEVRLWKKHDDESAVEAD